MRKIVTKLGSLANIKLRKGCHKNVRGDAYAICVQCLECAGAGATGDIY